MADVAAPVAQLFTQAHLLEVEGKPVQAKDALAVAKRLVRALEAVVVRFAGVSYRGRLIRKAGVEKS
jgi:hypothetical protein